MHRLSRMRLPAVGTVDIIFKKVETGKVDNSEMFRKTEPEQVPTHHIIYHLVILCLHMVQETRSVSQASGLTVVSWNHTFSSQG